MDVCSFQGRVAFDNDKAKDRGREQGNVFFSVIRVAGDLHDLLRLRFHGTISWRLSLYGLKDFATFKRGTLWNRVAGDRREGKLRTHP